METWDDDDLGGLTELEKIEATRLDGVSEPASGFPILMMKSLPLGPSPVRRPGAAPRRAGGESTTETLKKAAELAMKGRAGELRMEAKALRKRLARVEKSGPLCGRGHGNRPGARFCETCGSPVGAIGVVKSAPVDVPRQLDLIKRARSTDPATRDAALGQIIAEHGPDVAVKVIDGSLTARDLAGSLAKSETVEEVQHERKCKTCHGRGRLRDPYTGANGKRCPACDGTGTLAAGEVPSAPDAGAVEKLARLAAKALGGDHDAMGQLIGQVGPVIAARVLSGESVSAAEFSRGYVSAGRARQSAAAGQTPRIPEASHVVRPTDFQRGPLTTREARPAPASRWPGSGGQRDWYGASPGIRPDPGSAPYPQAGLAASNRPGL